MLLCKSMVVIIIFRRIGRWYMVHFLKPDQFCVLKAFFYIPSDWCTASPKLCFIREPCEFANNHTPSPLMIFTLFDEFILLVYRIILMSFRLKRKDIRGDRSQQIRTFLMGVAVLATMSPFLRKVTAIAEFPW